MKEREIDEVLAQATKDEPAVSPALLESIAGSIKPSLLPLRPMPPAWLLTGSLILIAAAVALAGAARAGFYGIEILTTFERAPTSCLRTLCKVSLVYYFSKQPRIR